MSDRCAIPTDRPGGLAVEMRETVWVRLLPPPTSSTSPLCTSNTPASPSASPGAEDGLRVDDDCVDLPASGGE